MHAVHTEKSRMIGGNSRKSSKRTSNRSVYFIRKHEHFFLRICCNQSSAKINYRTFCRINIIRRLFNTNFLCRIRFLFFHRSLRFVFTFCGLYVFRNVYKHRSGSSRLRNNKCFTNCICQIFNFFHKIIMFGNRQCNAGNIYFLKAIRADLRRRDITANSNYRNRIEIRCCNPCNDVSSSRSGCSNDYTDFSGGSCITVCGMRRPLLKYD